MKIQKMAVVGLAALLFSGASVAQTKHAKKKPTNDKSSVKPEGSSTAPKAPDQTEKKESEDEVLKAEKPKTRVKVVTIKDGKTSTIDTSFNETIDDEAIEEIVQRYTGKNDSAQVRTYVYKDGPKSKKKIRISRSLDKARKSLKDLDMQIEDMGARGLRELEREIEIDIPNMLEEVGEEMEGLFEPNNDEDVVIIRPDSPRGPKHLRIRPLAPRAPRVPKFYPEEEDRNAEPHVFKFYHRDGDHAPNRRQPNFDAEGFNFFRRSPNKRRGIALLDTVVKGDIVKSPAKADLKNALANAEITVVPSNKSGQFSIEVVSVSSEPIKVIVATKAGTELVNKTVYKEAGKFSSNLNVGKSREEEFLIQFQQGRETVTKKIRFGGR